VPTELRIKGQAELERAFLELRREVFLEMKASLLEGGKAVAEESQRRIPGDASNIGGRWSQFRIGATVKGVYVAPRFHRRSGSPRKNLAPLLAKAMEDALDDKKEEIEAAFSTLVDVSAAKHGFL
jgi:hypothetical protein